MDKRTYKGVSRADLDQVRGELGKYGISVPAGDDVEVNGPLGVKVRFTYNEPHKTLDLAIVDKPKYVSEKQIWKVIEMGAGRITGTA